MIETKEFLIELTLDDITQGVRDNCHSCPVARAIARAIPGAEPSVFHEEIELYGCYRGTATIPDSVSQFIDYFDDGHSVVPFSFELVFDSFEKVGA